MRQILFFIIGTLFFAKMHSQSITGVATDFSGKQIKLMLFTDLFTNTDSVAYTTIVKSDGSFQLNNDVGQTTTASLIADGIEMGIILEPEKNYNINIISEVSDTPEKQEKNYKIDFSGNESGNELNKKIVAFNEELDAFVKKNYSFFITKTAKPKVDSLYRVVAEKYPINENTYFGKHVKYSVGSIEAAVNGIGKYVFEKYLTDANMEWNNPAFIDFFNQFYSNYFNMITPQKLRNDILNAINIQKSYDECMSVLVKDNLSAGKELREAVLLKGLYDNYNNPDYDKNGINTVLKTISEAGLSPESKHAASNILIKTAGLSQGKKAPDFMLTDKNGKIVSLADFKGKYVYLDFWATWCTPCIKEMPVMESLYKKYGNSVEFVSISIDKDIKSMNKFIEKKKYSWLFLHYGNDTSVKDKYNVKAIPMYFLIDPDGLLVMSPAFRPSGGIEPYFDQIVKAGKKGKPVFLIENK